MIETHNLTLPLESLGKEVQTYIIARICKSLIGGHPPTPTLTLATVRTHFLHLSTSLPSCSQVAGEFKYHPECFACMSCKVIIEDGDAYALVQHTTLYW